MGPTKRPKSVKTHSPRTAGAGSRTNTRIWLQGDPKALLSPRGDKTRAGGRAFPGQEPRRGSSAPSARPPSALRFTCLLWAPDRTQAPVLGQLRSHLPERARAHPQSCGGQAGPRVGSRRAPVSHAALHGAPTPVPQASQGQALRTLLCSSRPQQPQPETSRHQVSPGAQVAPWPGAVAPDTATASGKPTVTVPQSPLSAGEPLGSLQVSHGRPGPTLSGTGAGASGCPSSGRVCFRGEVGST